MPAVPAPGPTSVRDAGAVARLATSRVVVVAGKGGVGKTTVTAVLARAAAGAGLRVLAVELDGKPALAELLAGHVEVRAISATDSLDEYLRDHGFARIAKRLATSGVIDVVATAAPGIDDIVVLGKIKQLERSGQWDLIVVDGPAAGHAITFLVSPAGMLDAVRGGPVRAQALDVLELLRDPARCQVVLVTVAEATPVNEVVETAFGLEDRVGVQLGPVVVNAVDAVDLLDSVDAVDVPGEAPGALDVPDPGGVDLSGVDPLDAAALRQAAEFRRARRSMAREQLERLAAELPLPQVRLPARPVAGVTASDVEALAALWRDPIAGART